ncbi:MAG: metallopeptidase family protein [Pseudomonadota bacterium]
MTNSLARIEAIATETVRRLPDPFRKAAQSVIIRVEDWPDETLLRDMGLKDPMALTGLYEGIPMTEKSAADPAPFPDVVTLFRAPILHELDERYGTSLEELVTHVTVHEFAHHFGWSDGDIAKVDRWWE